MQTLCNTTRIADAIAIGNAPLITGEWSLATAFNTTFDFLRKWGDAQKLTYAEGSGWTFWNWKIIVSDFLPYPQYLQWSYKDALEAGLFTAKPYEVFDKDVCKGIATVEKSVPHSSHAKSGQRFVTQDTMLLLMYLTAATWCFALDVFI